jgi:alkaline phosphatase
LLPANRLEGTLDTMGAAIRTLAKEWLGVEDLTDAEVESLLKAKPGRVNAAVGSIIAKRAKIGFTTNGHTGEDVVLYSYDPRGRLLGGLVDNTQLAAFMAQTLGVDLDATTARLFQDAVAVFTTKGAQVDVDTADAENPVLVVKKGDQTLRMPRNKSLAWLNDQEVDSDGVTVFNGTRWFVAQNLVDLVQ